MSRCHWFVGRYERKACLTPPRLIDKVRTEAPAQKNILEAFASVGSSFPSLFRLSAAVKKDERKFFRAYRFLIKDVSMIAVCCLAGLTP